MAELPLGTPPQKDTAAPVIPPQLPHKPLLRLHLDDIGHPAAQVACSSLDGGLYLTRAIEHVVTHLYRPYGLSEIPKVRSVTVVLRPMGGVAYTTGLPLDDLHKEIHLSLDYVHGVLSRNSAGLRHEIAGVITHEMVHCFQGNCQGTAPGGLIEGIADFVRLKAGLSPPHWNKSPENRGQRWDEGYQKTAWFLDWLEELQGPGTVSRMNETMRKGRYHEHRFWKDIFGESVDQLWVRYKATWGIAVPASSRSMGGEQSGDAPEAVDVERQEDKKQVVVQEQRKPKQFAA
ncbi:uncharacterized protein Z520_07842 [Fonsecaea multimorphosa CBS 102226]|uniref:Uncharacterized protein n=1 Tax=Fonsecaea multimorphosa CBS 102226 TaxID=1442371 RepID=A0A0D2IHQ8_9EURO|nr:uncharacterized protein Z520_07842 [Fonsecaea multimorphosa CBS 102226]KIX96576.1 hypothetical protein Z520_07842 [Fonsecaea multimorphosa CBS 102226]OAL22088.1 hypothetical protein AYO22_07448 [Fonsecaea multimorphosa]